MRRELRIWRRRPIYLLGSVVVMTLCAIFYLTFLKEGVPSDVPIGVVDMDNSSVSRNFINQLDATQLGKTIKFENFPEARDAMQQGKITSICVLPQGMYEDIKSQRQPKFSFYINSLYFLGGSLAYKDILTMINLTSGAVQRQVLRMQGVPESELMGRLRPIDVDIHQIGNATMNYGAYLANMMLPGMLQMVIIIIVIYAFGTELKYGTSRHLLKTAGDSMDVVFYGKMTVYTILFTVIGMCLLFLLYDWMHFPMHGSIWSMSLCMFLFVLACESVAVFIVGLIPVTRFALSLGGLYSVLGLSLTGFTLPVEAMPQYIQGFSAAYPLRHYYMFYVSEGIYANGFASWYPEIIHLLIFIFLPFFVRNRLKRAYINQDYSRN